MEVALVNAILDPIGSHVHGAGHIAGVINKVTPNGEAGTFDFIFVWAYVDNNVAVSDGAVFGDIHIWNEEDRVGTLLISDALGKAAKFIGKGAVPSVNGFGLFDKMAIFLFLAGLGIKYVIADDGRGLRNCFGGPVT